MKRNVMKLVSLIVVSGVLAGCGSVNYDETTRNEESVSIIETTTDNTIDETDKTTDVTKESDTKEVTTEKATTAKDKEETTKGDNDFDVMAERIDVPEDKLIDGYDFSDSIFIGDSRTEGLKVYGVLTTSTILATRGLMASSVLTDKFVEMGNTKVTVIDYLKKHKAKKIYTMFGINEVGCDISIFERSYKEFIREIRVVNPDAEIYVQSIIPLVEGRTNEVYNNEVVARFNEKLKKVCKDENVAFLNVSAAVVNEKGTLEEKYSRDGIHLNEVGLKRWVNYLIKATCE